MTPGDGRSGDAGRAVLHPATDGSQHTEPTPGTEKFHQGPPYGGWGDLVETTEQYLPQQVPTTAPAISGSAGAGGW